MFRKLRMRNKKNSLAFLRDENNPGKRLDPIPRRRKVVMLQKISSRFLATASLGILILVTILYYIEESFFPGHGSSFMLFGQFVGGVFFVLMVVAAGALSISAFKLVYRHIKEN